MASSCSGEGATHHNACDCRELHFAKMEFKFREMKYLLEKLTWLPALDPKESKCLVCRGTAETGHMPGCRIAYLLSDE